MPDRPKSLDAGALERIQEMLEDWRQSPFSAELPQALDYSIDDKKRLWSLLTMLREEDAPLVCSKSPENAFNYFTQSCLFEPAGVLLEKSGALRRKVGLERAEVARFENLPPPVYEDDLIVAFRNAEDMSRWNLWGMSKPAIGRNSDVVRVAGAAREPPRILNVGLSGPSGLEKDRVAEAIHGMAKRGAFAALGPGDSDPESALSVAMPGGTLYLRDCDGLQGNVQSTLYTALVSRVHQATPMDTLLIIDTTLEPMASVSGIGEGFSGTLGREVTGNWSYLNVPDLKQRLKDVPVLVNKTLERLQADDLAEVRHHLACWLWEEIKSSGDALEDGWLQNALADVCEALCPGWAPRGGPTMGLTHDDMKIEGELDEDVETSPDQTAIAGDTEQDNGNLLSRTSAGWALTYNGALVTIATDSKGMTAIAYLLSVGRPPHGAHDVATAMDSGAYDPLVAENQTNIPAVSTRELAGRTTEQQDLHQLREQTTDAMGIERQSMQMTREQVNHLKQTTQAALANIEGELKLEDTGQERREELLDQKKQIKDHLSAAVNIRGVSRESGPKESRKVGNAIGRALAAIEKQAKKARNTEDGETLTAFHLHLVDCIEFKFSDDIRYERPDGTHWKVESRV